MTADPGEKQRATWAPGVGDELRRYLATAVSEVAQEKVKLDAIRILEQGTPPGVASRRAGLVVGYVQSGKTMSFTAVTALARDNGYPLVIVIAGTSEPLLEQTRHRLEDDLQLHANDTYRRWLQVNSPLPGTQEVERMAAALEDWLNPDPEVAPATVLVTVMKQHVHLDRLAAVLEELERRGIALSRLGALIIDDEADQASPNVKRQPGEVSATYGRIRRLRAMLPSHTLLQYTATPQAPLLVSIADEISPDYVYVIEPGAEYTGGRYFFQEHRETFIRHIPADQLAATDDDVDEPPQSLLDAFACFALGCVVEKGRPQPPSQRSMLVHPSHKTLPQGKFVTWLKSARDLWGRVLADPEDPACAELVETLFAPAYQDLSASVADLPPLPELLSKLPGTLKKISIEAINATRGKAKKIQWSAGYGWVLVGGTLLDRGFTVEGLTVTYMPRGVGVGNADTVQQRARFFGYKRPYAQFCRAWLDPEVDDAFSEYVRHEELMRSDLVDLARSGQPLKEWRRRFVLDPRLKPTRNAVIRMDLARPRFSNWWNQATFHPEADGELINTNRELVDGFCSQVAFEPDQGDARRPPAQRHLVADLGVKELLESLLASYVMTGDDSTAFVALQLALKAISDGTGDEIAVVYRMAAESPDRRRRSLNDASRIKNLFQGSNAATGYPGDRKILDRDRVTVQIHRIDLGADDGTDEGSAGRLLLEDVPVLAFHLPERLGIDRTAIVERAR
jgi:hypothetical protein